MINPSAFILCLMTSIICSLTCLFSCFILICVIHHLYHNRLQQEDRIINIHCINIYSLVSIYIGILALLNIQTVLGIQYGYNFNLSSCIFLGYLTSILISSIYWAFVNQAFFRLCRVVYPSIRWLQSYQLYIILPFIELIFSCILISPILFLHDIVYLPQDNYCFVSFTNVFSLLWLAFNGYGNQIGVLLFVYIRITIFLRHQSNTQSLIVKHRQERDLLVIRRILITVGLLISLGIPAMVFIVMSFITHEDYPLTYPFVFFFISISMIGVCLSTIIFTPQLKTIVVKIIQHNRVIPLNDSFIGSIPMRQ
ncbi:unnamed protein product [Adineta steineri]|uniref:G-protein coupled receptors family 1 profile domain-containing protein n=1 Tax=Adineta steineri TaxID=433720 RepID=A0A819ZTI7_9BILA|nr:unnamed protein product [Adineta steineri]CAF0761501.1 unnamed protein product [Adineta steineri]CAF0797022.1 unnamed protein product [Adineta steineri]CAF4182549.1 unnamed protein product [Adineta steineri]